MEKNIPCNLKKELELAWGDRKKELAVAREIDTEADDLEDKIRKRKFSKCLKKEAEIKVIELRNNSMTIKMNVGPTLTARILKLIPDATLEFTGYRYWVVNSEKYGKIVLE